MRCRRLNPRSTAIARGSTQTSAPIGASDVVYIEVTHPARPMPMLLPAVTWRLDSRVVAERSDRLLVFRSQIVDSLLAPIP